MFNKLFEQGYVPIPIYHHGKRPALGDGWQRWCKEKPTNELIDQWQANWKKNDLNIGVTCGEASGIIVLDIDTDDKEFLDFCPKSPVARRGKKGEARFFKYRPEIANRNYTGLVDILSTGKQALIPNSIHPDTLLPYRWTTPDTLMDIMPADLPTLSLEFVASLDSHYKKSINNTEGGRNNSLVRIITAMRGRGAPESDIINEIYEADMLHHSPRLFTDSKEGFRADNEEQAKLNAWRMVNNVTRTAIQNGTVTLVQDKIMLTLTDEQESAILQQYKAKDYPEPTGLLKDVRDLIVELSERKMPNIALGGAVALMGAVCSNRFRFNRCWSNIYVLNLAQTGAGKSFPQTVIDMILNEGLGSTLPGFGNYQSSGAFTKNLISKRERFDVIDEVSSLFAQMKGGGLWQMGILEEMCKVWSSSSGKYSSAEYAEKEDTSSCFNPCVSILGSSTIDGIKPNISKMMVMKGLLPRFLIFKDDAYGPKSLDRLNVGLLKSVTEQVGDILSEEKREKPIKNILFGPIFDPTDIAPTNKDAVDYFEHIKDDFFNRIESTSISDTTKDMLTRGKEQTMKLAIGHAAGNFRRITVQDLSWAKQTFEVSLFNSSSLIEESAVDSEWEIHVLRVLAVFQKKPFVTESFLSNRVPSIQPIKLKSVIQHLITREKIVASFKDSRGGKLSGWILKT